MTCKSCGAVISENTKYCGKCGLKTEEDIMPKPQSTGTLCPKCGAKIADGANFCEKCGTNKNATFKCEDCGAEVSGAVEFCPNCGAQFETEKTKQEDKADKGRRRSICFCTFSAIFVFFTYVATLSEGESAKNLKLDVMLCAGIALMLGVIALIEAYKSKGKISIIIYLCIIISVLFLMLWGIKGDEIQAQRLKEYYSSGEYKAKQMLDAFDKLLND